MLNVYSKIFDLLSQAERRRFFILLGLVLVLSVFEALSVLSILPFLQVVSDPSLIESNAQLARAYEWGGFTDTTSFLIAGGIVVFVVTVVGLIFKAIMIWVLTRFAMMRSYNLSARLLNGYLHQPYIWFLNRHSSDLGQGILAEVDRMVSNVLLAALRLIPDILTAILMVLALFIFEPGVAIGAALLLGGAYGVIYLLTRRLLLQIGQTRMQSNKTRFHTVQEAMGGVKELKLMGLEDGFLDRFRHAAYRMARSQTTSQVVRQLPRYALEALAFGGMILLILVLLVREDGNITALIPTLGLIAAVGIRMIPALQQIFSRIAGIRFNIPTLDKLHADLMDVDTERYARHKQSEKRPPMRLQETLQIKAGTYAYPNTTKSALKDLNLEIKRNTTVGIVGGTGAGKTTVVDVVLGLLELQSGALTVDGVAITQDNLRAWQKSIGYVPQQIFLSDGTVAENIAFGVRRADIDMAHVAEVARIAALDEFVRNELPDGYDTTVGERGVRLSGGQRQRIGIARALYRNPDVIILDEATSALDNLTEQAVMDAVHALTGSKTIIMIAHRLTTVRACDTIFAMRHGAVGAAGTFDELVETDEEFRAMVQAVP